MVLCMHYYMTYSVFFAPASSTPCKTFLTCYSKHIWKWFCLQQGWPTCRPR